MTKPLETASLAFVVGGSNLPWLARSLAGKAPDNLGLSGAALGFLRKSQIWPPFNEKDAWLIGWGQRHGVIPH
jgi:hypothetical protein